MTTERTPKIVGLKPVPAGFGFITAHELVRIYADITNEGDTSQRVLWQPAMDVAQEWVSDGWSVDQIEFNESDEGDYALIRLRKQFRYDAPTAHRLHMERSGG